MLLNIDISEKCNIIYDVYRSQETYCNILHCALLYKFLIWFLKYLSFFRKIVCSPESELKTCPLKSLSCSFIFSLYATPAGIPILQVEILWSL